MGCKARLSVAMFSFSSRNSAHLFARVLVAKLYSLRVLKCWSRNERIAPTLGSDMRVLNIDVRIIAVGFVFGTACLFGEFRERVHAGAEFKTRQAVPCAPSCNTLSECGPTILVAGEQPGDLKVAICGESFDTIEAFFREELFYREKLPGTANLHCGNVALAPRNDFGTFAVRFGPNLDSFKVYGWRKDSEKPEAKALTLEPGYPIAIQWMTTRILKVTYGPNLTKEYIIRFNDSNITPWTELLGPTSK